MAAGILEGVGGSDKAIMTFHPQPNNLEDGGSSKWFHNDAWLDFNMFQTVIVGRIIFGIEYKWPIIVSR